jgi:hypothetical protein
MTSKANSRRQPARNDSLRFNVFAEDLVGLVPCVQLPFHNRATTNRLLDVTPQSLHIALTMTNLTPKQFRKAADMKERTETLEQELNQLLGAPIETAPTEAPKGKRKMSAAGRARIRAAAKARWAAIRAAKGVKAVKPVKKGKKKMSAQGVANIRAGVAKRMAAQGKAKAAQPAPKRPMSAVAKARLSALAKARWAKAKKAGKATL